MNKENYVDPQGKTWLFYNKGKDKYDIKLWGGNTYITLNAKQTAKVMESIRGIIPESEFQRRREEKER